MSPRILIVVAMTGLLSVGLGATGWMVFQPTGTPEDRAAPSGSSAAQSANRERFFDGDPDRSVRGGQEMKPRW